MKIISKSKVSKQQIIKFVNSFKETEFKANNNLKKIPWKYINDKKFRFYFCIDEKKIIGSIVILNNYFNKHLYFLYILKKFRYKGIGTRLLKHKFLKYKNLKTIHVLKSLNKTIKFYKKFKFNIYKQDIKINNLHKWKKRCQKFNPNIFKEKYLVYKK